MPNDREYIRTHPWISFRHNLKQADPLFWSLLGEAVARCDQVAQSVLPPPTARKLHQIYLVKGARATTAIEGNTLSEEQIEAILEDRLDLPRSQKYLEQEVSNVLDGFNRIFESIMKGQPPTLTAEWIAGANQILLAGLEEHLEEGVVPGQISTRSVGVFRYRGAPRQDCAYLLDRLCKWLESDDWILRPDRDEDRDEDRIASAILRAIFVHLYLAWIHAFGDGNGRTARLAEFMILAREGVPSPCAHLLSDHYTLTRAEYYRQLARSSRVHGGRGDPYGFLLYSLEGFVDGLRQQNRYIEGIQLGLAWEHFVYSEFQMIASSKAMRRRREVTHALGQKNAPVSKRDIPDLSTNLARLYSTKTVKTLTRDLNWLVQKGFLNKEKGMYRAKVELMHAFRPQRA